MPTLFKFIGSPAAAQSIVSGAIKFTPIGELNDPSELNPALNLEAVEASLRRLREKGYSQEEMQDLRRQGAVLRSLAPEYQAVPVPRTLEEANRLIQSKFYDSTSTLERLLTSTARIIASKVGVFCLSKRFDSLPMWAHYASNASGLAIEFANLESSFRGDDTGVLRQLREVKYEREIEGVTFDPKSHESLFFSKYSDWSYEQEVRVVLPLLDCRVVSLGSGCLHLYDVPPTCVQRVIVGWNMPMTMANEVQSVVAATNRNVQVVRAQFRRGCVSLSSY